jgi:hypothetical protein
MKLSSITNWLGNVTDSAMSVVKIILLSKYFTKKHRGGRRKCVILANGPSLNNSISDDKEYLTDSDLVCVNSFPLTDYYTELKPETYIFAAPEYWKDNMLPIYEELRENIFSAISEKTDWELTIFAPFGFKHNKSALSKIASNEFVNIVYFNTVPIEGMDLISDFFISRRLGMPRPHNVLVPALITTINSGYKDITILGADHSWLNELSVNDDNEALVNQKHFYDNESSESKVMYKLDKGQRPRKLHEILEKFVYAFKSYHYIERFARSRNVTIWNATPDSFIDAFERKQNKK